MKIEIDHTLMWDLAKRLYVFPIVGFYQWGVNGQWLAWYFDLEF